MRLHEKRERGRGTYEQRFRNAVRKLQLGPRAEDVLGERLDALVCDVETARDALLDARRLDLVARLELPLGEDLEVLRARRGKSRCVSSRSTEESKERRGRG